MKEVLPVEGLNLFPADLLPYPVDWGLSKQLYWGFGFRVANGLVGLRYCHLIRCR